METLLEKSLKRKAKKAKKQSNPELVCKTVEAQELKAKLNVKLFPLFSRSMSAKHEKSTKYIGMSIRGELPNMRIANRVRQDYAEYQKCINNFVSLLEN